MIISYRRISVFMERASSSRAVGFLVLLAAFLFFGSSPAVAGWGRDKGWENKPVAKMDLQSDGEKKARIDAYHEFAMFEIVDGKLLVRVAKEFPVEKVGGVIVPLGNRGERHRIALSDKESLAKWDVRIQKMSETRTNHVQHGQFAADAVPTTTTYLVVKVSIEDQTQSASID